MKIMGYATKTIKEFLALDERYDLANWSADSSVQNIITGVLKEGKPISILIRPTDGNRVVFHKDQEKDVMSLENSELWGCSKLYSPQLITFGKVLKWNNIN